MGGYGEQPFWREAVKDHDRKRFLEVTTPRRHALRVFAIGMRAATGRHRDAAGKVVKPRWITSCEACARTAEFAANVIYYGKSDPTPSATLVGDLFSVLVGDGFAHGRASGEFYAGHFGDSGFKEKFRDAGGNQVQHAMAGIAVGFAWHSFASKPALLLSEWSTPGEQDSLLYEAAFALGETLTDDNYLTLGGRIRASLAA
jgi:hypothetical protein